jgi:serine/threonine protein phosphatase 1
LLTTLSPSVDLAKAEFDKEREMKAWFGRSPAPGAASPKGSPGKRLYAIGDVHGCFDELQALLELIERDHRRRAEKPCHIVFLGDLVDRGPQSREVLSLLRSAPPAFAQMHVIKGNHEEMMVRSLSGEPELIPDWLKHGGRACAISYGVDPAILNDPDLHRLEHTLLSHIPEADIKFLAAAVDTVRFGDYCLVHAGVRPGVPLGAQTGRDLRWIRQEFLNFDTPHEAYIVHGHTISESVAFRPNRVGIDTGAYQSGILTALRIEGEERELLAVGTPVTEPAA